MYVRFPLSLRNVEDCLPSAGSTFVTRRCGTGGTAVAGIVRRNAPPISYLVRGFRKTPKPPRLTVFDRRLFSPVTTKNRGGWPRMNQNLVSLTVPYRLVG
jgi:hypothetical protein